jgi:hypothetical protein
MCNYFMPEIEVVKRKWTANRDQWSGSELGTAFSDSKTARDLL